MVSAPFSTRNDTPCPARKLAGFNDFLGAAQRLNQIIRKKTVAKPIVFISGLVGARSGENQPPIASELIETRFDR
jgi:hypothetical protein